MLDKLLEEKKLREQKQKEMELEFERKQVRCPSLPKTTVILSFLSLQNLLLGESPALAGDRGVIQDQ